jgi:virulence-associated protein VagC
MDDGEYRCVKRAAHNESGGEIVQERTQSGGGLPAAFWFDGDEVYIRRDPTTGDVILSAKPRSFDRFFAALAEGKAPDDFLG